MIVYLTSSPTGGYRDSSPRKFEGFDPSNGFVEELKKDWKRNSRCLLICADPEKYEENDKMGDFFEDVLLKTGLTVSAFTVCDYRNVEEVMHSLSGYDFVILGGGHVPTQNQFFEFIHLRHLLPGFNGIVMGISAGSMNCAEEVYAQPELEGEVTDPMYRRFMAGLGLTQIRVIPHFQAIRNDVVDGKRIFEDVTCPDSVGRKFFALTDGSFILKRDGVEKLYGEGYLIMNGKMRKINEKDHVMEIHLDQIGGSKKHE